MIGRNNYAAALVGGSLFRTGEAFDALALPKRHGRGGGLPALIDFYAEVLHGTPPDPAWRDRLMGSLNPKAGMADNARRTVALILASPEAQLC
jgi:hypothetical protein